MTMKSIIRLFLLVLATQTSFVIGKLDSDEFLAFLEECADGHAEAVEKALTENPAWATESSPDGETCLHVAGIHGEVGVTKVLLEKGVNPNLISHMIEEEQDEPIEMHALSWHVFSGHLESVKLLLDHGADPNLLMDSISDERERVTVLDLLEQLLAEEEEASEDELEPYMKMKEMLIERGAKRRDEL